MKNTIYDKLISGIKPSTNLPYYIIGSLIGIAMLTGATFLAYKAYQSPLTVEQAGKFIRLSQNLEASIERCNSKNFGGLDKEVCNELYELKKKEIKNEK